MPMREWTDIDYAQAAIDMLPDTVEEMVVFLRQQNLGATSIGFASCPIAKWARRWTGNKKSYCGIWHLYPTGVNEPGLIPLPPHVRGFVVAYTNRKISL